MIIAAARAARKLVRCVWYPSTRLLRVLRHRHRVGVMRQRHRHRHEHLDNVVYRIAAPQKALDRHGHLQHRHITAHNADMFA